MTNEQQNVRDWMKTFGQATPDKPAVPDLATRKLRAKLILEEALETIKALGLDVHFWYAREDLSDWPDNETTISPIGCGYTKYDFEQAYTPNLTEIADGCSDLKVVTEGCLVACGLVTKDKFEKISVSRFEDAGGEKELGETIQFRNVSNKDPLFDEVMRSNWSKMWKYSELATAEKAGYKVQLISIKNEVKTEQIKQDNVYISSIDLINKDPRCYLVKDSNGKVIKSPSYSPANLNPIIEEMSK